MLTAEMVAMELGRLRGAAIQVDRTEGEDTGALRPEQCPRRCTRIGQNAASKPEGWPFLPGTCSGMLSFQLSRPLCFQAEHLTSCYWGGSSNALDRHDPSLPYLEQYRIDFEQFKGMFALLFPWACGAHSDVLASRLFQLLDENGDSLINFREFVSGLSKGVMGSNTCGVQCWLVPLYY